MLVENSVDGYNFSDDHLFLLLEENQLQVMFDYSAASVGFHICIILIHISNYVQHDLQQNSLEELDGLSLQSATQFVT